MDKSNGSQSKRLARRREFGTPVLPDAGSGNTGSLRADEAAYYRQARVGLALLFLTFTAAVVVYAAMSLPHLVG